MGAERISPTWALRGSPSPRTALLWVAGWLMFFGVMSYSAALQKCATFDEPLHAVSGAIIRQTHDYRIDPEDPALFTWLSTVGHSSTALRIDPASEDFLAVLREHNLQWDVAIDTLYRTPGNDGAGYINQSRFLFMLIGIGLGALLAWWAYRIAGPVAAMIAAALYALDPNFLAHASLVKNDVISALLMLWLAYLLWLIGQRLTVLRAACIAACCCVAINVKFSGLILLPIAAAMLVIRAMMSEPWGVGSHRIEGRFHRILIAGGLIAMMVLVAWAGTWAIYAQDRSPSAQWLPIVRDIKIRTIQLTVEHPTQTQMWQIDPLPDPISVKILAFLSAHHVMPHTWLTGFLYTYDTTIERPSYLLEKHSLSGWWYYFPLAMLFKTPLTVLVIAGALSVLACIVAARQRNGARMNWTMICLWTPVALYGGVALITHLNLGIRHILPIYPFIYLLMSKSLARWLQIALPLARPAMIIALLALAAESIFAWPDYIPFFNIASGGARGGIKLLADSNLDWGQDLPLLAQWQRDHPDKLLYFSYFGTADPAYYGIVYINILGGYAASGSPTLLPTNPGVFAISATNLQGVYSTAQVRAQNADLLAYLWQRQPMQVLGGSIYLYDWQPADFAAFVARQ